MPANQLLAVPATTQDRIPNNPPTPKSCVIRLFVFMMWLCDFWGLRKPKLQERLSVVFKQPNNFFQASNAKNESSDVPIPSYFCNGQSIRILLFLSRFGCSF